MLLSDLLSLYVLCLSHGFGPGLGYIHRVDHSLALLSHLLPSDCLLIFLSLCSILASGHSCILTTLLLYTSHILSFYRIWHFVSVLLHLGLLLFSMFLVGLPWFLWVYKICLPGPHLFGSGGAHSLARVRAEWDRLDAIPLPLRTPHLCEGYWLLFALSQGVASHL